MADQPDIVELAREHANRVAPPPRWSSGEAAMWAVVVTGLVLGVFGAVAKIDIERGSALNAFWITLAIVGLCVWLYVRGIETKNARAYSQKFSELLRAQRSTGAKATDSAGPN